MTRAVVLFSGGQDSTTCLHWALPKYDAIRAVSIDYGQRHRTELDAARRIAARLGVPHEVLDVLALAQLGGNALVDTERAVAARDGEVPTTFVPMRNIVLLSLAASRAVQWREPGYDGPAVVVCGACEQDFSGYPDCRRKTIDVLEKTLTLAVDGWVKITTPLMRLTKADTVRLARTLPGCWESLAETVTCYHGRRPGCGECPACVLRRKGFDEAGESDPAEVRA
jgi:7-cyano-7-deazaguanine synthase